MNLMEIVQTRLGWIDPRLMAVIEKYLKKIPAVKVEIEKEYDSIMGELDGSLKPYRDSFPAFAKIPEACIGRD